MVTGASTLWATWINSTVLKHKNFWITAVPTDCSWIWKKLLRLSPLSLQFISYKIGRGESISLWFNPRWNKSTLATTKASPIFSQCNLHSTAKVCNILHTGGWNLPHPNPHHHHLDPGLIHWIGNFNFPSFDLNASDTILWDGLDAKKVKVWNIWLSIRNRGVEVFWHNAV